MTPRILPPGKFVSYSNHGYALLGRLVEVTSGQPFAQYVDENIFQRLNMHHSSFLLPPAMASDLAVGYWYENSRYRVEPYESHLLTDVFQRGLEMLEQLALASTTAILCAERDPAECHRRHIADCLAERGWEVIHLLGNDEARPHRPVDSQRRLF